jgi:AcrR family transcriptional regulator
MGYKRRPQILAASARVIATRGITGLRLADVAAEAGVSVGTVQHYFRTRERLLMETFQYETNQAVERWFRAADGGSTAWRRLLALVDIVLDEATFRERWTRWLQFWAVYARDPRRRRAMGETYEQWREPFRAVIEEGVAAGEFRPAWPVEDAVDRIVALVDGLALQVLLDAPGASTERMRELLVASLAADLGVDPASRRDGRVQRSQKRVSAARVSSIPARPRVGSSGT